MCLMIILKFLKYQGFALSVESSFKKPELIQIDPPAFLGLITAFCPTFVQPGGCQRSNVEV